MIKSVIKPTAESIGVKLYKQMKRRAIKDNYNSIKDNLTIRGPSFERNENKIVFPKAKGDSFGLGYKSLHEIESEERGSKSGSISAVLTGGKRLKISGEAFGYGALDDDNEDDAVVYHNEDISQYDFAIGNKNKIQQNKLKAIKGSSSHSSHSSHDVEGFSKASEIHDQKYKFFKKYPPPHLPRHWKPKPPFSLAKERKSRWDEPKKDKHKKEKQSESNSQEKVQHEKPQLEKPPQLNANVRAVLLGEEVIHLSGVKNERSKDESQDDNENKSENQISEKVVPLSGFWNDKFVRSSQVFEDNKLVGGLNKVVKPEESEMKKDQEKIHEPIEMKRDIYEWHPHNVLCKRFNVKNPYPQYPDVVGIVTVGKSDVRNRTSLINEKPKLFTSLFQDKLNTENKIQTDYQGEKEEQKSAETQKLRETQNPREEHEEQKPEEEEDEENRPPMDLFKAIFASDEEDEDNNNDVSDNEEDNEEITQMNNEDDKQMNDKQEKQNTSHGLKIFAHINFNRIIGPTAKPDDKKDFELKSKQNQDDNYYGPALPPQAPQPSLVPQTLKAFQTSEVQESHRVKKKKKKDKKKKHKKHSKHKKHHSSSTSSSEDDANEDIDMKLIQFLKNKR